MKRLKAHCVLASLFASVSVVTGTVLAQESGVPAGPIKDAYRQMLSGADKDADGKLSLAECMSISNNKSQIEKDCKYWDANDDRYITEEEYVARVKAIFR